MRDVQYSESGAFLSNLRRAKGWTQQEFAVRACVTPQTVSRWERGLSRPRVKELPSLATLLGAKLGEMAAAVAYTLPEGGGSHPAGAPTYDISLPLQSLRPDSFENFSVDFLVRYYRSRAGVVNRFGDTGSKQYGIDIEVRGNSFGVHTFQCKRVEQFGEQKVHAAVSEHSYISDLNILLLSNIASPKARMAITQYAGWQLWDRVDISAKFRELSMVDRRDLVDTYFRGQRQALLGEPESGPFQTPENFFKGFIESDRYFNHSWALVGRDEELDQLIANVLDDNLLVTMLLGAPGNGKTRLLREVVGGVQQQRPDIAVLFVSPTENVKAQHLEELGVGAKLLMVDDAHDRDDLTQLMRYASVPENKAKLLLALRSYGGAMVRSQASLVAMDSPQMATVELRPHTKQNAQALATQVLRVSGGPLDAAEGIAELTYPTPLVTVLAAQIVARENTPLALISNNENFQAHVFARLEKIITGQIVTGQDVPKLQAVLRMVALLQPVVFDDPGFLKILGEIESLEHEDVQRLLRLLSEGGVLFKRGLRHRLAPDLLADSIIQRSFIDINGTVTHKVEQVFDLADTEYLKHLLVNLGRLDWRLRNGETEGSLLLSSIAPKLQCHNPHIQAVEAVAYYQPRLALSFAERLIEQNHGDESGVCGMVRNAAFNLEILEEACALLWCAGKNDVRALHSQPNHGIRILKELAEFAPNKPVGCVERVVAFAIELLERPATLRGIYTPFTILEGALRTDMEEVTSSSHRSFTITRYQLDFEIARTVRAQVIEVIVNSLEKGSPRKAFLAAVLLSEALRSPMYGGEDVQTWEAAHADLLARVRYALDDSAIHPVVLVQAGMSVRWHAFYNHESECGPRAQAIIALLDRDLPTRLVRFIADAWGNQTWHDGEQVDRKAHEADIIKMMSNLAVEFPDPVRLYEFLTHWLNEIEEIAGKGWGTAQIFINRLLQYRVDLAKMVMTKQTSAQSPLKNFAGAALAVLMADQNRHSLISELLEAGSVPGWILVSEAYARLTEDFFTDDDMPVVRRIFQSREPAVLRNAAIIARQIALRNPILAVELMCIADLTINPDVTHEFFMWLTHDDTIPTEVITLEQWRVLLKELSQMRVFNDHWVLKFLKKAVAAVPADVIDMLKIRLQIGMRNFNDRALRRDGMGDGLALLSHPDGRRLLQEFLTWAVKAQADDDLMDIGACVSGLCGKYGAELLDLLLELVDGGNQAHVSVVSNVLRNAHQEFVVDETPFIREVLNQAELIGEEAVKDISSALLATTTLGGRFGVAGEPFEEDVVLQAHTEKVLSGLSKMDPTYRLYARLLRQTRERIERQAREKRTMEEEDM